MELVSEAMSKDLVIKVHTDSAFRALVVNLSVVENSELTKVSLDILHMLHSQMNLFKETVEAMIFIDKPLELPVAKIQSAGLVFKSMAETAEKWFLSPNDGEKQTLYQSLYELQNQLFKKKYFPQPLINDPGSR